MSKRHALFFCAPKNQKVSKSKSKYLHHGDFGTPAAFRKNTVVEKIFHHGEVRENTTVPVPLHHGAVKTPPWCRKNSTMVEWERHHGEISKAPW